MATDSALRVAVVIAVIVALAAVAYEKGWLDRVLPLRWQKISASKSTYVGAYGRTPAMQQCYAFADGQGMPFFNRCSYM
jgi:hypothetical protein